MSIKDDYRRVRAVQSGTAMQALERVRYHHNVTLPAYREALAKWDSEPDKRRYAPGGSANRPKCPALPYRDDPYTTRSEDGRYIYMHTRALDHLREPGSDDMPRDYGTAWYCDAHESETITGKVAALPRGRFLAYVVWSDSDGITVDASPYCSASDAAYAADSMARRIAEDEREHSERWNAASEHDDKRTEARGELRDAFHDGAKAIAALRASDNPSVQSLARSCLADARERMREAIRTINAATDAIEDLDMTGEF